MLNYALALYFVIAILAMPFTLIVKSFMVFLMFHVEKETGYTETKKQEKAKRKAAKAEQAEKYKENQTAI